MDQLPYTSTNVELVEAVTAKLKAEEQKAKAESRVVKAIAMKHRLIGLAALVLGAGVAVGFGTAGFAYFLDQQSDLRKPAIAIAEALAAALSATEIPVKAVGSVDLDTSKAAPVKLSTQDAAVPLDTSGAVVHIVDGDLRKIIEVAEHYLNSHSLSPAAGQAVTSLDVVKVAHSPSGLDIVTRWEHTAKVGEGAPVEPMIERCFVRQTSSGAIERLVEIARNERPGTRPKEITEQNFQESLHYCVWSHSES